ncbi:MAG TPA: UDP-glucuronic acid decarboxylase family protein [Bauldia sp.]|nr:UDP-glucuronic acid decarboxylase family protein [Bauldia sp.]
MIDRIRPILVTGGAGFLGSHLCDRLIEAGAEVICLDNLFTGSRANLAGLEGNPHFRFVRHDVTEAYDVPVGRVFNLACPASPVHYWADPVRTVMTSVAGAANALEVARRYGATVLQASTSEVYGDPLVDPQPESYWGNVNPIGRRACYDEGKRCAETLFFDYRRRFGSPIKVARIFNTYGPRMHPNDGRVVSNFIVQALLGRQLTVHGDGEQTRSFCYVDDLVDGLIRLMDSPNDVTGPINLGNPHEMTVRELALLVLDLTGSKSRLVERPGRDDDPQQRRPDIAKARDVLGWHPRTDLRDGLARTVEYFDRLLADPAVRQSVTVES